MIIIYSVTYPMSSIEKATNEFIDTMKNDPLPDFVNMRDLFVCWGGEGVKAWVVYDIDEAKVDSGIRELTRRLARYSSVEGYKIEADVVLPIEEALAAVGKKMP